MLPQHARLNSADILSGFARKKLFEAEGIVYSFNHEREASAYSHIVQGAEGGKSPAVR